MKYRCFDSTTYGFTLIELSIVLVIIGLIVSGITGGRNLIESSQISSVVADYQQYSTALNAFILEYDTLPGDIDEATAYWGSATSNGDGDYLVEYQDPPRETLLFWEHLTLAGLVGGTYSGVADSSIPRIGINVPETAIDGAGFEFRHTTSTVYTVQGEARHLMQIAGYSGENYLGSGALTPKQAKMIDRKMDDGLAASGNVISLNGGGVSTCISGSAYSLSNDDPSCRVWFWFKR